MNETDVMHLLAKANPVQEDDLMRLDIPENLTQHLPNRRLVIALAAVVVTAAVTVGALAFNGSPPRTSQMLGFKGGAGKGALPTGPTGANGPTGPVGTTGGGGPCGPTGSPGHQGPSSGTGPTGTPGPSSGTGPTGAPGPSSGTGPTGTRGPSSGTGPTGSVGPTGGVIGPTGGSGYGCSASTGQQGPTGASGNTGAFGPLSVHLDRTGSTLDSIRVAVRDGFTKYLRLEIRYRASDGSASASVVYASETNLPSDGFSLGPTGPDAPKISPWSGTITPSDWSGGCQAGVYWLEVLWRVPDEVANDEPDGDESTSLKSAAFRCTGG